VHNFGKFRKQKLVSRFWDIAIFVGIHRNRTDVHT